MSKLSENILNAAIKCRGSIRQPVVVCVRTARKRTAFGAYWLGTESYKKFDFIWRTQLKTNPVMEQTVLINLVFLCLTNLLLALLGTLSNLVVILSIWKSSQLRKKTCYFMILLLSCFDLCVISVNHPLVIVLAIGVTFQEVSQEAIDLCLGWSHLLLAFSSLALFTMNIERYLALAYPIFHRNKVTRPQLVTLLVSLQLFALALRILSSQGVLISEKHCYITLLAIFSPAIIFTNFKMVIIARKMQLNILKKSKVDLKKISSCLLAVACFLFLSVLPAIVFTSMMPLWKVGLSKEHVLMLWLWIRTAICTNATVNCFVFYWNNKILRAAGKKLLQKYLYIKF